SRINPWFWPTSSMCWAVCRAARQNPDRTKIHFCSILGKSVLFYSKLFLIDSFPGCAILSTSTSQAETVGKNPVLRPQCRQKTPADGSADAPREKKENGGMMMNTPPITGRPSIDRPWMKYYPEPLRKIQIPECTVQAYLRQNCPGEDVAAMEFYGNQI